MQHTAEEEHQLRRARDTIPDCSIRKMPGSSWLLLQIGRVKSKAVLGDVTTAALG